MYGLYHHIRIRRAAQTYMINTLHGFNFATDDVVRVIPEGTFVVSDNLHCIEQLCSITTYDEYFPEAAFAQSKKT